MKTINDECVGCPPGMFCLGSTCQYKNVTRYYCDDCHRENELYHFEGDELCEDCVLKRLEKVEGSFY